MLTHLPLNANGVDVLVDDRFGFHHTWSHLWGSRLWVRVDRQMKATRVGAVPIVVVGIHRSHAELVCASYKGVMMIILTMVMKIAIVIPAVMITRQT